MTARLADQTVNGGHRRMRPYDEAVGFRCIHCRQYVSTARPLSGVGNRNHCPYCLHSRHLDWQRVGDRLAACKGSMMPVGLAFKHRSKRYGAGHGELMLVHRCMECGKLSINRIAADDMDERLLEIYHDSLRLAGQLRQRLEESGISLLQADDRFQVTRQLRGALQM